jgi:hypothetical protein
MQRRLTGGEAERIARAYDALLGFPLGLDRPATHDCRMLLQDMLTHNTTDGLPFVEPPLTDEDARQRPWVMVQQQLQREWTGPCILVCVTKDRYSFTVAALDLSEASAWQNCRRATPAEIAAAGLEVTK